MPRYYFDVTDHGGYHRDDVGLELPSMESAIEEARRALADMTRDALLEEARDALSIHIRDGEDGPVDLTLSLKTDRP